MRRHHSKILILLAGSALMACWLILIANTRVQASPVVQTDPTTPTAQASNNPTFSGNIVGDDVCLGCHGQPGLTKTLDNGDVLDLSVDAEMYAASIHGELGYACVQCHVDYIEIPHKPFQAADLRDVTLKLTDSCQRCHSGEYSHAQDSVHARAMAAGNREAAVCTDCHTAHTVRQLNDPETNSLTQESRVWIPGTCAQCHSAIYEKYGTSVHGSALLGEGNPDVPTCIDCHGVHNIGDPTTNAFRLNSPLMCARCHTDPERMGKYGLSTQVLNTYVADFHGTTITLFEKQSPDAETNKPVCFDCHGVHDIASKKDPQKGLLVRENILARCQVCHPDATNNFPDAWLSHYIPNPETTPLVYYVNLFYKFFIPGVLGSMAVLVVLDLGNMINRRVIKTRRMKTAAEPDEGTPETIASLVASEIPKSEEIEPDVISEAPASKAVEPLETFVEAAPDSVEVVESELPSAETTSPPSEDTEPPPQAKEDSSDNGDTQSDSEEVSHG